MCINIKVEYDSKYFKARFPEKLVTQKVLDLLKQVGVTSGSFVVKTSYHGGNIRRQKCYAIGCVGGEIHIIFHEGDGDTAPLAVQLIVIENSFLRKGDFYSALNAQSKKNHQAAKIAKIDTEIKRLEERRGALAK